MQSLMQIRNDQYSIQLCQICCHQLSQAPVQLCLPSTICYKCWHEHIKVSVVKISYKTGAQILSPFEGRPPLDICLALNSLKSQDAQQLEEWLFKKYSSFTPDIEKCPSQTCDYIFTMEQCKWRSGQGEKCPKCDTPLLPSAGWDLKALVGFIYFVFLTNKCPRCEIPIEKSTGCPHMTCPCGHQFCWYCLKDYSASSNNLYSVHQPRQCACIFVTKTIFMATCLSGVLLTFLGNQFVHAAVEFFLTAAKYVLGAITIDLFLIGNFIGANYLYQRYRSMRLYGSHLGHTMNWKTVVALLLLMDLTLFTILYYFDLHLIAVNIVLLEVVIGMVVAGVAWLVVYTVQTWFNYIC